MTDYDRSAIALLCLALGALALSLLPCDARASGYTARDQLALARVCASEIGLVSTPECAAIHQVLTDRARRMGISYRAAVCAYSTRTCSRGRQDARRWIAHLHPSGRRPEGWPPGASWPRLRASWLELYEHAGAVQRGEVASPCEGEGPHHWGGPIEPDLTRARLAGWDRVSCPGTRNLYYRVPGLAPAS